MFDVFSLHLVKVAATSSLRAFLGGVQNLVSVFAVVIDVVEFAVKVFVLLLDRHIASSDARTENSLVILPFKRKHLFAASTMLLHKINTPGQILLLACRREHPWLP